MSMKRINIDEGFKDWLIGNMPLAMIQDMYADYLHEQKTGQKMAIIMSGPVPPATGDFAELAEILNEAELAIEEAQLRKALDEFGK